MSISKSYKVSFRSFIDGSAPKCSSKIRIPDFQRNFVWSNKQIIKFIDSVLDNDEKFYIGNFVIQQKDGGENLIVDGQQRIVTILFILISIFYLTDKDNIKRDIRDILYVSNSSKKLRLSFSRKGMNNIYKNICDNTYENLKTNDKVLLAIVKRYKSIKDKVRKVDYEKLLNKIKKIELITINCESTHNVIGLYQGLNSTSKPLRPMELVKSLLIEENKNNKKVWSNLEILFSNRNPSWFDKFIRHHWFSIGGYISNDNLYDSVSKYSKKERDYINDLNKSANIYIELRDAEFSNKGITWKKMSTKPEVRYLLECLRLLRLDQVYAPLLSLLKFGQNNAYYLENNNFFRDLYKIYSFVVLLKFSDSNPNKVERIFAKFCNDINLPGITKNEFEAIRLKFYENLFTRLPDGKVFKKNIYNIKYSTKSEDKTGDKQLVDSLLSIYLLSDTENIIPGSCTIEHIFPQGNYDKWIISKNAKKKLIDGSYRYLFGNLTLLSIDEDRGKNLSFDNKYNKVYKNSKKFIKNIYLNKYNFASKDPSLAIKTRGEEMADLIFEVLKNNLRKIE